MGRIKLSLVLGLACSAIGAAVEVENPLHDFLEHCSYCKPGHRIEGGEPSRIYRWDFDVTGDGEPEVLLKGTDWRIYYRAEKRWFYLGEVFFYARFARLTSDGMFVTFYGFGGFGYRKTYRIDQDGVRLLLEEELPKGGPGSDEYFDEQDRMVAVAKANPPQMVWAFPEELHKSQGVRDLIWRDAYTDEIREGLRWIGDPLSLTRVPRADANPPPESVIEHFGREALLPVLAHPGDEFVSYERERDVYSVALDVTRDGRPEVFLASVREFTQGEHGVALPWWVYSPESDAWRFLGKLEWNSSHTRWDEAQGTLTYWTPRAPKDAPREIIEVAIRFYPASVGKPIVVRSLGGSRKAYEKWYAIPGFEAAVIPWSKLRDQASPQWLDFVSGETRSDIGSLEAQVLREEE